MRKLRKKAYKIAILILSIICVFSAVISLSFAYYTNNLTINGYANVKIELLFDKLEGQALTNYQSQFTGLTNADKSEWGHKGNPYVISQERHISNLSILQNIGYFYNNFIVNNYDSEGKLVGDSNYSDGYDVPYFVIATPEGSPVVIDASKRKIKPVGTHEYPFIGSLTGVTSTNSTVGYLVDGKTKKSTTSGIHGVKVQTPKSTLDYGFFGCVSYLGTEPISTGNETDAVSFDGYVSNISNILFSDVQVTAKTTIWEEIQDFFTSHLFYGNTGGVSQSKDPNETHHIGIVVGHAEYTKMSALSVYYSNNNIEAINLEDKGKKEDNSPFNYVSSTGYIGFMYNLNPEFNENGQIIVGSGIDSADISYGYQGGGGLASGILPGYIRAEQMYESYNYYAVEENGETNYVQQDGDLYLIKAVDKETKLPLATAVKNNTGTNYYFTDGVFTFAFSHGQSEENPKDTIEDIWKRDEDGNVEIDKIALSESGWKIGKDVEKGVYTQTLKLITSTEELDEAIEDNNAQFYIGCYEESNSTGTDLNDGERTGIVYFMNLTGVVNKEIPAYAREIIRTTTENQDSSVLGIRYKKPSDLTEDLGYTIKIQKNGSYYNFSQYNGNNKLGVGYSYTTKKIYCGAEGSFRENVLGFIPTTYTVYNDFSLSLDTENDNAWKFTNIKNNDESELLFGISTSGSTRKGKFGVDSWESSDNLTQAPICIYKVTQVINENISDWIYIPEQDDYVNLPANQYVFQPTPANGNDSYTDTQYEIKSLEDLGWKTHENEQLWAKDEDGNSVIKKMFNMKEPVDWKLALELGSLWGGSIGGNGSLVVAPVGTGAYQKQIYLPTGTLAFSINKLPKSGKATIKVIVKIPTSSISGSFLYNATGVNDNYLGIWEATERKTSGIRVAWFDVDNAYAKVEIPRSQKLLLSQTENNEPPPHSYDANGTRSDTQYLDVTYNGKQYTTMLQGGHYLLAYEFSVDKTGIFILGASSSVFQLVYCRVDGAASSGRDGTGGSILGNIDFVYDNGEQVLLVTDGGVEEDGSENADKYYYESYVLVHFANVDESGKKHVINEEVLVVRRWAGGDLDIKTNINLNIITGNSDCLTGIECNHILCSPINEVSDNITIDYTPKE